MNSPSFTLGSLLLVGVGALASYFACGTPAYGQRQPVVPLVTTQNDGTTQLVLHNYGLSAITAYAYSATFWNGTHRGGVDAFVDSKILISASPIPPNGEISVKVGNPQEAGFQCQFEAALFADGSGYGDPVWINRIKNRRQYLLTALAAASTDLASPSTSVGDLIAKLTTSKNAQIGRMGAFDVDVQSAYGRSYGLAIHDLGKLYPDQSVSVDSKDIRNIVAALQQHSAMIGN